MDEEPLSVPALSGIKKKIIRASDRQYQLPKAQKILILPFDRFSNVEYAKEYDIS